MATTKLLLSTVLLFGQVLAHTWNEQLTIIENGLFNGSNGYPRGYVSRSSAGFNDDMMTYLLPPLASGRTRVDGSDLLCAPTQRSANQTNKYPRLTASPRAYVAIKYLENGHVTLPETKPENRMLLMDVLQWTRDGTGGSKRGRLLTAQNLDDGRCYQINDGNISIARQEQFPNPVKGQPRSVDEQWCETDVVIPTNVTIDSTYTVYWVRQWPTAPGSPGLPDGKDEYYTTCSDIDITAGPLPQTPNPLPQQDPQVAAVANCQSRTAFKPNPL
ncbi:hypothetical protein K469DRAFT_724450 [Zopfia rhizophila CBS 207.26]|uniref:DUF7492 domain-containing protein n=1 Tax=Zopfia rhizophila CBS 207.26 TaxID=1314779 RepID=A0A6A6EF22_9PEZI|nr:hypothetical protein K469DRAFT_724450 [Zopfia rhizophila CBS 207.26]